MGIAAVFGAFVTLATVAHADSDKGDDDRGYERHAYKKHYHKDKEISVNCDQGQTLTKALEIAKPGTTISVEGTCMELVVITTDSLTLDGGRSAGIWGQRASTFAVRDTIIQDNALTGIGVVENSTAEITDCSMTGGTGGIAVSGTSSAVLKGQIIATSTK